ncbi:MAG TPA: hypothetical protein VGI60_08930 [Chthoniobacterales bacterium]
MKIALLILLGLATAGWAFCAQEIVPLIPSVNAVVDNNQVEADAPDVIFSNLARTPGDTFNSQPGFGFTVAGKDVLGETETWQAVRFVPTADTQAKILKVAPGYVSGTKRVNIGLYNNSILNEPGGPLLGAQGSTTQIPDDGECCRLAKVTLNDPGVTLAAGTPTGWSSAQTM